MSRSSKKKPFVEEKLLKRVEAMNETGKKEVLKTWSRASTIYPQMVGHTIAVHDGPICWQPSVIPPPPTAPARPPLA